MSGLHFIRASCIFYFIFVFNIEHAETTYKIKLVSLEKCKIDPLREYKNAPLMYEMSARKVNRQTTLVKGEFFIKERAGPVFFGVRGYQVQQSTSKDLILNLENIPCNNPLTFQLVKVISLKLDRNCFAVPGNYSVDNINIEDFAWILTKAMIGQGKYSYELEISSTKGVAACISLTCDISKLKNKT